MVAISYMTVNLRFLNPFFFIYQDFMSIEMPHDVSVYKMLQYLAGHRLRKVYNWRIAVWVRSPAVMSKETVTNY